MGYEELKTQCVALGALTFDSLPEGWTVYRVKTRSSTYTLGLFDRPNERHVAVLRGRSNGMGQDISAMDSDPEIGGVSLFEVAREQWIGKQMGIGTITTSPIESVEREHSQGEITSIVSVISRLGSREVSRPRESTPPPEATRYPLNYVEGIENTAAWLRRMANKPRLAADIAERREWKERVKIAMVNARRALEDLANDEHLR